MREAAPHWHAAREGRLVLPYCAACGSWTWPPRATCGTCDRVPEWRACRGTGEIVTYSVVRRAVDPALRDSVPYCVALVRLDEGVRLFTNVVDVAPEAIRTGMRVRCRFEPTTNDAAWVVVFGPEG
jgi:uncharacterized protein